MTPDNDRSITNSSPVTSAAQRRGKGTTGGLRDCFVVNVMALDATNQRL